MRLPTASSIFSSTLRLTGVISALGGESGDAGEGVAIIVEVAVAVAISNAAIDWQDMDGVEEGAAGRASACAVTIQRTTAAAREEMCMLRVSVLCSRITDGAKCIIVSSLVENCCFRCLGVWGR